MKVFALLACAACLFITVGSGQESRSLSEITYRFTNCGSSQHDGPRVDVECRPIYRDSPILDQPGAFFQVERFDGHYDGAQGFRIPRNGLYNITMAGASGGAGLCNTHYGFGAGLTFQVELTRDYEYVIMVGQRGKSVCQVEENRNQQVCVEASQDTVRACNATWYNWILTEFNDSDTVFNTYTFNGGGGGGGASMIWPRRADNEEFLNLPIAIAPGGGGASAVRDYDRVAMPLLNLTDYNFLGATDPERVYTTFVNGHNIDTSPFDPNWEEGTRGFRLSGDTQISSGSGGGWQPSGVSPLTFIDADGKLLSKETNFAEGGFECSSIFEGAHVFVNTFGGYGGGGGGCGGGGYTGGHVPTNNNHFPGGGGDTLLRNHSEFGLPLRHFEPREFNDGDGYIEIVPANCGCSDECVIKGTEFKCVCPLNNTLTDDGFNCFDEEEIEVTARGPSVFTDSENREEFYITALEFNSNNSLYIIGMKAYLSLSPQADSTLSRDDVSCTIAFLGPEHITIAAPTIRGTTDADESDLLQEIIFLKPAANQSDVREPIGDYKKFLRYPQLVTGAVLISNGDCQLVEELVLLVTSENTAIAPVSNFRAFLNISNDALISTLRAILGEAPPTAITTPPQAVPDNIGQIVGPVVLAIVILIALVGIMIILICFRFHPRKKSPEEIVAVTDTVAYNRTSHVQLLAGGPQNSDIAFEAQYSAIKQDVSSAAVDIDKTTGNAYATIEMGRHGSINPYSTLNDASTSMKHEDNFTPRYGIIAPAVDFTMFNRDRTNSAIQQWEYARSDLVYIRELGEGQFGKVLLMKAKDIAGYKGKIPVAVKTLTSRDPEVIRKFMEEAELMKKFSHPNIVSLLGISMAESDGDIDEDSSPLMILEYMPYGDLASFLTSHRPDEQGQTSISQQHFLNFTVDIARALGFLALSKYVHRDIAARNCLVGTNLHIKIADFGLSRGVYDKDYYKVAGKAVLPVRWMAPESLLFGMFSTASDIWSYGVTIWEITSYAETPLASLQVQDIVSAAQHQKLSHTRPIYCSDLLYEVMTSCHCHEPSNRPSFEQILEKLLEDNTQEKQE